MGVEIKSEHIDIGGSNVVLASVRGGKAVIGKMCIRDRDNSMLFLSGAAALLTVTALIRRTRCV